MIVIALAILFASILAGRSAIEYPIIATFVYAITLLGLAAGMMIVIVSSGRVRSFWCGGIVFAAAFFCSPSSGQMCGVTLWDFRLRGRL